MDFEQRCGFYQAGTTQTVSPKPLFPNDTDENVEAKRRKTEKADDGSHAAADGECDDGEAGEEMSPPRQIQSPTAPSPEERDSHNMSGHAVYRCWCQHCVRGRCREWGHSGGSSGSDGGKVPIISFDYGYLCQRDNTPEEQRTAEANGSNPLLVMWDSMTKAPYTWLLPAKGLDYLTVDHAIDQVARALTELGYKRIVVRSDGEASLVAFLRAVIKKWGGEVVPEQPPQAIPSLMGPPKWQLD